MLLKKKKLQSFTTATHVSEQQQKNRLLITQRWYQVYQMHASLHLPKNELYKFGTYSRINGNIHALEMHCIFSLARSWLRQTLYLLSLLTIKAPTHTDTHNRVKSFTLNTQREREREREREEEWRGEGSVCDWSFGLHSIMACQAPAPTWVHSKSYSSWYKSVPLSLSVSNLYQPVTMNWNCMHFFNFSFWLNFKWHILSLNEIYLNWIIIDKGIFTWVFKFSD